MAVVFPQKIVLRNSTGISLSDRFGQISRTTRVAAMQMAPETPAAIIIKEEPVASVAWVDDIEKKSLAERLGGQNFALKNVHERLGSGPFINTMGLQRWGRGGGFGGGMGGWIGKRTYQYQNPRVWNNNNNNLWKSSATVNFGRKIWNSYFQRNNARFYQWAAKPMRWQAGGQRRYNYRRQFNNRGGGVYRWGRQNYRGGRGGRYQFQNKFLAKPTPTKEELDNQIDDYMSQTKVEIVQTWDESGAL